MGDRVCDRTCGWVLESSPLEQGILGINTLLFPDILELTFSPPTSTPPLPHPCRTSTNTHPPSHHSTPLVSMELVSTESVDRWYIHRLLKGECIRMIFRAVLYRCLITSYPLCGSAVAIDHGMQAVGKVSDDVDEPSARVIL